MAQKYLLFILSCFFVTNVFSQDKDLTDSSACGITKRFNTGVFGIEFKNIPDDSYYMDVHLSPLFVDLDNDGELELITMTYQPEKILIINPTTGAIKKTIQVPYYSWLSSTTPLVIADIDYDGYLEIILATADFNNISPLRDRLICYEHDGTLKWISNQRFEDNDNNEVSATPAVADFNQDGIPEVYILNRIFNAQTGVLLAKGKGGMGIMDYNRNVRDWVDLGASLTVAANLDNNPKDLELAAGYTIYKVVITNTNGESGNTMTPHNILVDFMYRDGRVAIADINSDGKLDVIVSSTRYKNQCRIYAYTLTNGEPVLLAKANPQYYTFQMSTPIIGDIEEDGKVEIMVNNGETAICYQYDGTTELEEIWNIGRYNGEKFYFLTMYDFNFDGSKELIFRKGDTYSIYKSNQSKLEEIISLQPISGFKATSNQPIIGQVNSCEKVSLFLHYYSTISSAFIGKFVQLSSPDTLPDWAPTFNTVNQYGYNTLFLNKNNTVPDTLKNHAIHDSKKFNNFLIPNTILDAQGHYIVKVASLSGGIECVSYDFETNEFIINYYLRNHKNASTCFDPFPVSFYSGNPELGGELISTVLINEAIKPGKSLLGMNAKLKIGTFDSIWMVINTYKLNFGNSEPIQFQIDECDYTDNVYQALLPTLTSTTASICTGETYTYYGRDLTTSGTYLHEVTDTKGCDSLIYRLELEVSNTKTQSLTQRGCEVYVWRDTTILSSGTYVQRDLSASGCDSITTLHLTIYPKYNAARTVRSCDSFSYAGMNYTRDAIILDDRQSIFGCDSTTTIDLRIHPSITQDITRAACVSYTWNGTTYTDSGNYTYRGQTSMGCDSIINLALTISDVLSSTQAISGCDRYSWNGTTYTESGSYTYAGTSVSGCDSLATLDLSIGKSQSLTELATACDSYRWNGQLLTASGDYTYTTANISGCDSTTVLLLTLHRSITADILQSSCNTYTWNGTTYTTSGNYSYLAQTSNGCDSTVRLALTILAPDQIQAAATACGNYPWNGTTYDRSGTYSYQTLNGAGCDSIVTLELTIYPVAQSSMILTACDSVVLHGRTLRDSGDYRFELATQYGCDSIVTVSLTTQSDRQSTTLTACDTYTWAATGDTYTQSGRYSASYTNVTGCDSTHVLNLQIASSYLTTQNANACERYTWPTNQITYTESGDYMLALKTQAGCDSIQTLALRIDPVFEYRDTVTSATTYTWPINAQDYEKTGVYSEVYQSISVCDSVYWLHLTIKSDIDIYTPNILSTNGTNNYFTLFSNNPSVAVETMNIYDRWGNLIYSKQNFPLNDPTSGWDGKMGGRAVVPGVYVWVAVLRLSDGTQVTKQGDVTVF